MGPTVALFQVEKEDQPQDHRGDGQGDETGAPAPGRRDPPGDEGGEEEARVAADQVQPQGPPALVGGDGERDQRGGGRVVAAGCEAHEDEGRKQHQVGVRQPDEQAAQADSQHADGDEPGGADAVGQPTGGELRGAAREGKRRGHPSQLRLAQPELVLDEGLHRLRQRREQVVGGVGQDEKGERGEEKGARPAGPRYLPGAFRFLPRRPRCLPARFHRA